LESAPIAFSVILSLADNVLLWSRIAAAEVADG
jgi:hypothetical protein